MMHRAENGGVGRRPGLQEGEGALGYVRLPASIAALGGLLFGYDTAVIAGAGDGDCDGFSVGRVFRSVANAPLDVPAFGPGGDVLGLRRHVPIAFFFVLFYVPETKGKTLEEIERGWTRSERRRARVMARAILAVRANHFRKPRGRVRFRPSDLFDCGRRLR